MQCGMPFCHWIAWDLPHLGIEKKKCYLIHLGLCRTKMPEAHSFKGKVCCREKGQELKQLVYSDLKCACYKDLKGVLHS